MGDAAAIMGVSTQHGGKKERVPKKPQVKRPANMSREVFQLLNHDEELPPIAPQHPVVVVKQKRGAGEKVSWRWEKFDHAARTDGVQFNHWTKKRDKSEYAFAKCNKVPDVVEYSDEEYTKLLQSESWSREETDALIDLAKQFNLRFFVIQDRFPTNRTVEELKERYYSIAKQLLLARCPGQDLRDHPLISSTYNRAYEERRKRAIEEQFNRSAEEIAEEMEILQKAKEIERTRKQVMAEKKMMPEKLQRKAVAARAVAAQSGARKQKSSIGVSLRSRVVLTPITTNSKLSEKVDLVLEELGLGIRPMPTQAVAERFDALRQSIVNMFDMQKQIAKQETDLQMLVARRASLMSELPPEALETFNEVVTTVSEAASQPTSSSSSIKTESTATATTTDVQPDQSSSSSSSGGDIVPPTGTAVAAAAAAAPSASSTEVEHAAKRVKVEPQT